MTSLLDVCRYVGMIWGRIRFALIDFDADGAFAYVLALFADPDGTIFPGLAKAPVIFEAYQNKREQKYGKWLDKLRGVAFDISGRRPGDHHPHSKYPGESAFLNIAVVTGLYDKDPVIRRMADNTAKWDVEGGGQEWWEINSLCKYFLSQPEFWHSEEFRKQAISDVITVAKIRFKAWYGREQVVGDPATAKQVEHGTIWSDDRRTKACIIEGDSLYLSDAGQYAGCAVTVQVTSEGYVWIRGNKNLKRKEGIDTEPIIQDMVRIIRATIAAQNEVSYRYPEHLLTDGDELIGSECVYYASDGQNIFIGGNARNKGQLPEWWNATTRKNVIDNALTLALNRTRLPIKCPGYSGEPGCIQEDCPFHGAMLPRCMSRGLTIEP